MSREQNAQPRHDARAAWRAGRRRGDTVATFRPGEELRCPGWLRYPGYEGPCGWSFGGETANPHTRVIIRVRRPSPGEAQAGTDLRCGKCGTSLEKLTILEAKG